MKEKVKNVVMNDNNIGKLLVRVSQKVVIYDESLERFLVLKASPEDQSSDSYKNWLKLYGPWDLPGGHVDAGEDDFRSAFARELYEEVGVELDDKKFQIISVITHYNEKRDNPVALIPLYLIRYSGEITLSSEHESFEWMAYQEVLDHKEIGQWIKDAVSSAKLEVEKSAAHDKMLRTLAEFDNYKKRTEEQRKEFTKYASEKVIMEMLPVLDNFHAATSFVPQEQKDSPWLTGIMYIQKQMEKVFEDAGVIEMEISLGDDFDTATMEAIEKKQDALEPEGDQESEVSEHKVVKIINKGYKMGDKVLRAARVELS